MKILFLVDGHVLHMGGAEIQAINLANHFKKLGHKIEIVSPHLDKHTPKLTERDDINVRQLGYWRIPRLSNIFYMIRFAWFLRQEGRNYDAIHIHMVHKMASITGLLRRYAPCPVVAKVSGSYELYDNDVSSKNIFNPQYWLYKSISKLDHFQAISSDTSRQLARAGIAKEKILALPNGVDTDKFTNSKALHGKTEGGKTVICFNGRLVPVKGIDTLLAAANILQAQFPDQFELHLNGGGQLEQELQEQVKQANLESIVLFKGRTDSVEETLQLAHIYVQASHYEGLSNAVLEAMASGLPLVLSDIGGNRDVIKDDQNGYLAPAGDANAFAAALTPLIADREKCRTMGQKSREIAESEYSLEYVTQRLLKLYSRDSAVEDVAVEIRICESSVG